MDGVVAGAVAGAVTTITMHPFDVAKVRLQIGRSPSFRSALTELWQSPLREAYRGLSPNFLGNAAAWGAYFGSYEMLQGFAFDGPLHLNRTSSAYLGCSFFAGVWSQALTNPIWVLKTRILGSRNTDVNAPRSISRAALQVYQKNGLLGFWRGFLPGTLGTVQSAMYFAIYSPLKPWIKRNYNLPDTATYFIASALAKSVAATAMYPHQVLRSRMQFSEVGIVSAVRDVWRQERLLGFYRGLSVNLVRVVPAMAITLVTYELCKEFLDQRRAGEAKEVFVEEVQ